MKGFKYFFNLWGRNIKGNFDFWFSPEKIKARPLVRVPALIIGIPLTVISPIAAFFKTGIDYVTRTSLPKQQESRLKMPGGSLVERIQILTETDLEFVATIATGYKPRSKYFTSKSTADMMHSLASVKQKNSAVLSATVDENTAAQAAPSQPSAPTLKGIMSAYAADPKNANKGMFKLLAEEVLELTPEPEPGINTLTR